MGLPLVWLPRLGGGGQVARAALDMDQRVPDRDFTTQPTDPGSPSDRRRRRGCSIPAEGSSRRRPRCPGSFRRRDAVPAKTARIIGALSGFALVDGAVLFDRSLTLLRVGAILKSRKQKRESWTWDEWTPGQRWRRRRSANISELGGTRHRSAFRFVVENPGAVAVVCSQDGSISMMAQPPRSRYPLIARGIERAVT